MSIIFKTFRTYAHPYVYDRHTNAVVMLTEDEYKELAAVEKGALAADDSAVIKRYQEQGLFVPNVVHRIEHTSSIRMEPYLKTRIQQLTLQVTQQCNLRCEYCAYSGVYEKNRIHNSARMSFETAKKAIDFFLKRSSSLSTVVIGFYGGEPLLEFGLIKRCVEYAVKQVEGKEVKFNMTTNGTLLSEEIIDFLVENDFHLSISLDGSQEEHDRSRKFKNGKGTFEVIVNNIKRIREKYPEYDKRIQIMTTINPHMDVGCVVEYFDSTDIFSDKNIMFNMMNVTGLKEPPRYDQDYYCIRNFEYIKLLLSLVKKIDLQDVSKLVQKSWSDVKRSQRRIKAHSKLTSIAHHNGPCLPGVRKLFVRTDGKLYPCERINEAFEYFCIGNLDEGFKIEKANNILNIGKLSEEQCISCWALKHCSMCAGQLDFDFEPDSKCKLCKCNDSKYQVLFSLKEACVLNEFGMDMDEMGVDI